MIHWLRKALLGAILLLVFVLFIRWDEFRKRQLTVPDTSSNLETSQTVSPTDFDDELPSIAKSTDDIPVPASVSNDSSIPVAESTTPNRQHIDIVTDTLHLRIDPIGGDIVFASLLEHNKALNEEDSSFTMLTKSSNHTYIAQSGLVGRDGIDSQTNRPEYQSTNQHYEMTPDEERLIVDLTFSNDNSEVIKRFSFTRGSYLIKVDHIVKNTGNSPWQGTVFGQIKRDSYRPVAETGFGLQPYVGAATTTVDTNYKKLSFSDLEDEAFKFSRPGGWVAMIQHYFVSAWVPNQESNNQFWLRKKANEDMYILGFTSSLIDIEPGETAVLPAEYYVGPKNIKKLEQIAPYLDLTIDYSWLWFIAKPLFYSLDFIHSIVGNWGVAIIILTILIKGLFFYPSAMSYRSMAKMRKIQPKLVEMKEQFGDDRQRMSQEMMKLYKKEKVNPVSGCLPILMQMPVFIALYWVLMESVELRHAPFILWIEDLSVKDPYFVLPLIMGVTMWLQQKLQPTPTDPMQAKLMQMMPIFFTFLFIFFPAGLVLYWVVNNTLSIAQQYIITRQIETSNS